MPLTVADLSFVVEEQTAGGYAISLDLICKASGTNTVVASTSPTGNELQIYDNGDGTYTIKNLPAGYYDIYVNGQPLPQPELTRIGHIGSHLVEDDKHRKIDDAASGATDLWSASKIQSELNTKAASGHNHDASYSPINHNHDADYAAAGHNHDAVYMPINPVEIKMQPQSDLTPSAANAYKLYWVKANGFLRLKAIVPVDDLETSFDRAVIWEIDLATGTTGSGTKDGAAV